MSSVVFSFYKLSNLLFRFNAKGLSYAVDIIVRLFLSAWIPGSAKIGRGTRFGYGGLGIVIHNRAVIGDDCLIDQHVTIGGTSKHYGVPRIGSSVYVGAGSKILGPITIGDNVVIGANSVIVKNVPSGSLVVGVPGKVIKSGITKSDYV